MYYLAANPDIQDRARQEVLDVMGDSPEDVIPTREELKQMEYLDNCIHETMRINPPTSGNLPRVVTKDTNLGGFFVPKETRISIVRPFADFLFNIYSKTWSRNCIVYIILQSIGINQKYSIQIDSTKKVPVFVKMLFGCHLAMVLVPA